MYIYKSAIEVLTVCKIYKILNYVTFVILAHVNLSLGKKTNICLSKMLYVMLCVYYVYTKHKRVRLKRTGTYMKV